MGLKAFHVVFITVCTALSLALTFYFLREWRHDGGTGALAGAVVSLAGGAALCVYGSWFLKKMDRLP
jgi:hypothetical protein